MDFLRKKSQSKLKAVSRKIRNMLKKRISVVIPCYNEEGNILPMYGRLLKVFKKLPYAYEFIYVNNGSIDGSYKIFKKLAQKDTHVVIISLSRNFYKSQGAYTAGIDNATGDAVVLIDGDIQDPPEVIPDLIKKWEKGYDVVYGVRVKRKGSLLLRICYKFFYKVFKSLSYINIPVDAGDFSIIDKKVAKIISAFPEKNRYIRGLRAWVGFRSIGVDYIREERYKGLTTNSFIDNIRWALFAIFSFSYVPLELISWLAAFTVVFSTFGAIGYTISYFFSPGPQGFQTLLLVTFFLGGIQLVCFSIIAQYMSIILDEIKGRPKYIVEEILNKQAS